MIAGGLAPQTARRRPGILGRLVLIFIAHVAHALRLGTGALVLGALVFLVECLTARLALGSGLGGGVQIGHRGRHAARCLGYLCGNVVDCAALFLELLGHATHLPSSATPR